MQIQEPKDKAKGLNFAFWLSVGDKTILTRDVGQHDNNEAVVVVERHVILVREPQGVHSRSAYKWQSSINGEKLSNDSQGVQDDEEVVSTTKKSWF